MTTLEKKVSLLMEYLVEDNRKAKAKLKEQIMQMLTEVDEHPDCDCCAPTCVDKLDDVIDDLLREIGCPCHVVGYNQAVYAIKLAVLDGRYLRQMTDRLYPAIAIRFGLAKDCPERNIRHLVALTFGGAYGSEDAYKLFKNTVSKRTGKPTNQQFLAVCANEITRRMRDLA